MSASAAAITRQLKRIGDANLPFAPDAETKKGLAAELKRIIGRDCRSDTHLESAVTYLIERAVRFPTPADLIDALASIPRETFEACESCGGTGFVGEERRVRSKGGLHDYTAWVSDFCDCPLGVAKRQAAAGIIQHQAGRRIDG